MPVATVWIHLTPRVSATRRLGPLPPTRSISPRISAGTSPSGGTDTNETPGKSSERRITSSGPIKHNTVTSVAILQLYTGRYEDHRPGGMEPEPCLEDSDLDANDYLEAARVF